MICPKCKKNETSILKTFYESLTNTVKRQRTCKCGNLFITYEIDKSGLKSKSAIILKNSIQLKKKRRPSVKEEWIDFRVFYYGFLRVSAMQTSLDKALKKFGKKYKTNEQTGIFVGKMPNRKSYVWVRNFNKKGKTKDFVEEKIENVKKTIGKCIASDLYWKKKKFFFKNIVVPNLNDKNIKNAILKEIDEFNRSITSYVRKSKYDTNFYTNNSKFNNAIFDSEDFKGIFDNKKQFEEYIAKKFTLSKSWLWFESIR
jgi:hypothetical protein